MQHVINDWFRDIFRDTFRFKCSILHFGFFVVITSGVQSAGLLKYVVTGDRSSHVSESEVLPGFGEILFHTDVESGCSSMTWKYREQRIIDRLCVMPVPFSISAEYDMIDHNFQVSHHVNLLLN